MRLLVSERSSGVWTDDRDFQGSDCEDGVQRIRKDCLKVTAANLIH